MQIYGWFADDLYIVYTHCAQSIYIIIWNKMVIAMTTITLSRSHINYYMQVSILFYDFVYIMSMLSHCEFIVVMQHTNQFIVNLYSVMQLYINLRMERSLFVRLPTENWCTIHNTSFTQNNIYN